MSTIQGRNDGRERNADRRQRSLRWLAAAALVFVAALLALRILSDTGAIVRVRIVADAPGYAQWYFDRGAGFSEGESRNAALHAGLNDLAFRLPRGSYRALRFDPINNGAHTRILALDWDLPPGVSAAPLARDRLVLLGNIRELRPSPGALDVWPVNDDPQLNLPLTTPLPLDAPLRSFGADACAALELAAALTLLCLFALRLRLPTLIALGLALAAGLIFALATTSTMTGSVHPDEFSHLAALDYYTTHVLPPAVDDPATLPSTSVWGFSYLFELDVVYDIAAHATAELRNWLDNELLAARLFQCSLFVVLLAVAAWRRRWAPLLGVLLLSPQIWYVFGYLNADAFPLWLALIAAGLFTVERGGVHAFLRDGGWRRPGLWLAALCLGLILVSKRNYLPFVPIALLWLAVRHLGLRARHLVPMLAGALCLGVALFLPQVPAKAPAALPLALTGVLLACAPAAVAAWGCWRAPEQRPVLLRLVAFALLCAAVAAPRLAWDIHVNGWPAQKSAHVRAIMDERAGPTFKPSVAAAGKGEPTVALAARGVPLTQILFQPYGWLRSSGASAFGVYGYMNVVAPIPLYFALGALAILTAMLAFGALRRAEPARWPAYAALVLGGSALVAASSLLLSWFDQLQPQGRYLFPIVALAALLLGQAASRLPQRAYALLLGAAVLLSACSFAFVALPALIPRG